MIYRTCGDSLPRPCSETSVGRTSSVGHAEHDISWLAPWQVLPVIRAITLSLQTIVIIVTIDPIGVCV